MESWYWNNTSWLIIIPSFYTSLCVKSSFLRRLSAPKALNRSPQSKGTKIPLFLPLLQESTLAIFLENSTFCWLCLSGAETVLVVWGVVNSTVNLSRSFCHGRWVGLKIRRPGNRVVKQLSALKIYSVLFCSVHTMPFPFHPVCIISPMT